MASTLQFTKQLITVQDMALGIGQVEQIRNGIPYTLDMINASNMAYDNEITLKDAVDTMYAQQEGLLDQVNASEAATATSEHEAQLSVWRAVANELTTQSYALEAEDTFCKIWTSNDDGTFSYTNSTDYSSKHWSNKAATSAASVDASNIIHTEGSGLDNELLTYLKTIDGEGSGLDADLLDGLESIYFSRSIANVSDLDLATVSGVYDFNGWTNLPSGAGEIGSLIVSNAVGETTAARQIYIDSLNNAFTRYGSGIPTVWGSWASMWTSANQGAGSGLDADMLDGTHLSSIAKKTDYATSTVGGTVKMRVDGDTLYITNDGSNA